MLYRACSRGYVDALMRASRALRSGTPPHATLRRYHPGRCAAVMLTGGRALSLRYLGEAAPGRRRRHTASCTVTAYAAELDSDAYGGARTATDSAAITATADAIPQLEP